MTLSIGIVEGNDVANRLFSKLGFGEDERVVTMTLRIK